MSSIRAPFVGPRMPSELKVMFLSYLPLSEQCKARRVCKEWLHLLPDRVIWKPIYKELHPFIDRLTYKNTEVTKKTVLADLEAHQETVERILALIDDDSQLASIIGSSFVFLCDLKSERMLPLERALHVMRGVRKNCTELFLFLAKRHQVDHTKCAHELYQRYGHQHLLWNEGLLRSFVNEFCQKDQCLPLLQELINDPPGPFNASETLSAVLPLAQAPLHQFAAISICASIIKSHRDLSEFFQAKIKLESDLGDQTMLGSELAYHSLIPIMEKLGLGVNMDDWLQCGLPSRH